MYTTFFYAMLFLVIPLGLFFLFGWLVVFHLKRYGLEGSFSKRAATIFSTGLIIISTMIVIQFLSVDWQKASPEKFIETSSNNFFHSYYGK